MGGSVLVVGDARAVVDRLEDAGFEVTADAVSDADPASSDPASGTTAPDCVVVADAGDDGPIDAASVWTCPTVAVVADDEAGFAALDAGADDYVTETGLPEGLLERRVEMAVEAGRWRRTRSDGERREWVLARLHEATRELMHAETEHEVATTGVRAAKDIVGLARSTCFLLEDGVLEPVANTGAAEQLYGEPPAFEPGQGVTGTAFAEGRMEVLADGQQDERADPRGSDRIRSFVAVPLGEYGVLTAASPGVDDYDEADLDGVRVLAANMEAALERAARERTLAERERELARRNEQLESFTGMVSHDLRNPLNVARGHVDLAAEHCDHDSLRAASEALDRMNSLVEEVLELARHGQAVGETDEVDLAEVATDAWATVDAGDADLTVAAEMAIEADTERLRALLENLFRNSVEHGSTSSRPEADDAVEHGSTSPDSQAPGDAAGASSGEPPVADAPEDDSGTSSGEPSVADAPEDDSGTGSAPNVIVRSFEGGFLVADDGPGIPEAVRDSVFDHGFSTNDEGTGFGLAIVRSIAEAHGWTVELGGEELPVDELDESYDGARFVVRTD